MVCKNNFGSSGNLFFIRNIMSIMKLKRGNPYSKSVLITDSAGNALDLTGRTIFCSVKKLTDNADDDSLAVITKEITEHTSPTEGQSVIMFLATDTDIDPGIYKCDLKVYGEGFNANCDTFYIEIERTVTERTE